MQKGLRVFPNEDAMDWAKKNKEDLGFHFDENCSKDSVFIWSEGSNLHSLEKRLKENNINCIQSMKLL